MKKVGIIMGSDSDLPVVRKAVDVFRSFGVPYVLHVYSAHRSPEEARQFAASARENGYGVLLAFAGMAAHLAGALAASTIVPVIGVPVCSGGMGGLDALLSTVMMPSGVPVATVGTDNGTNAALLALEILALEDEDLAAKLLKKRESDRAKVLEKDAGIEKKLQKLMEGEV